MKKTPIDWLRLRTAQALLKVRPAPFASFLKRAIGLRREIINTPEGRFFLDRASVMGRELCWNGFYEASMIQTLKHQLAEGSTFVDLGANEGYFTVLASRLVGERGRVLAVEPQQRLQKIIYMNLELNQCKNVEVIPMAVSDKSGRGWLYLASDMNTGSSSFTRTTRYPLAKQEVPTTTLSDLLSQRRACPCDLIKIDIEGGEYEAILGSRDLFEKGRVGAVALELHPGILAKRGLSEKPIVDFLYSCGYRLASQTGSTVFVREDT